MAKTMTFDKVIGIDAGAGGGIAVFGNSGIAVSKMPITKIVNKNTGKKRSETDIEGLQKLLMQQAENYTPIVFLERVQSYASDSDTAGKRFLIQRMLANYEALKTVLKMLRIPFLEVRAIDWQKYLNLHHKGLSKPERKRKYVEAAKQFYPTVKATLWSSDAVAFFIMEGQN
jgi:hypothetical protein